MMYLRRLIFFIWAVNIFIVSKLFYNFISLFSIQGSYHLLIHILQNLSLFAFIGMMPRCTMNKKEKCLKCIIPLPVCAYPYLLLCLLAHVWSHLENHRSSGNLFESSCCHLFCYLTSFLFVYYWLGFFFLLKNWGGEHSRDLPQKPRTK